ncbi:EAL domain-containing protein [Dactylosporangium sp. AC04546]|uniref:EAL and HDOD domain-containing protein n=1 Tax=Dactylosporangium sp. AC04546 TaxID=2862460 RepID=UPI001EE039F0|nr:EAL domain-containing protein [Dactylosporangium sp. AC04546]WVK87852.1 EAL domain-containing protein [Dactylosporangium sp. AC04546]
MLPPSGAVHVGRQPIFDRLGGVHGYELLFRGDAGAVEADKRGAYATSRVLITAFTEIGIEPLCGRHLCFVNLTREFLVGELPLPFDHEQVVLEILETVDLDEEVVAAVARLVAQGYRIALDDYVFGLGHEPLLELAAYVKIDVLDTPLAELAETVARCRKYDNLQLVAERLETPGQLDQARELGFDYFQGYVLGRPQVVSAAALSPSRLARVELLSLLVGPSIPLARVVGLVTSDPALALRLTAAANADALGLPVKVSSVHEAVLLLGVDRLRDWATLMLVSDLDDPGTHQLSAAITRARMCQNIAARMALPPEAAFTVGLVSSVAELLGQPAAALTVRLSLSQDVTEALVAGAGPLGELLSLVAAYEASDLPMLLAAPLPVEDTARAYLDAVAYTGQIIAPRPAEP